MFFRWINLMLLYAMYQGSMLPSQFCQFLSADMSEILDKNKTKIAQKLSLWRNRTNNTSDCLSIPGLQVTSWLFLKSKAKEPPKLLSGMRGGKFISANNFSIQQLASSKTRHILNFRAMAVHAWHKAMNVFLKNIYLSRDFRLFRSSSIRKRVHLNVWLTSSVT